MNTASSRPDLDMTQNGGIVGVRRRIRAITISLVTLAAASISFCVSYAAMTQKRAPVQALRIWPSSSDAKALLAAQLMTQPDHDGSYASARQLARYALLHQPLSVRAIDTLVLLDIRDGHNKQAERLLTYSEHLSRRDLPTQLALIEIQVQSGNIPGALVHYDRALRTSKAAEGILIPVLVNAVNAIDVARALASFLAARADWWKPFTLQMIQQGTSAPSSYVLLQSLHLNVGRTDEHDMAEDAMRRMAGNGRVDLAARLYTTLQPHRPISGTLHDGAFRLSRPLGPFDWDFADGVDLSAVVEARPDGKGNAVFLVATNAGSGVAARQLVVPSPGRYALTFDIGGLSASGARITASVRCNGSDTPLTFVRPAPPTSSTTSNTVQRVIMPFTVRPSCQGLWIEFSTQAGESMGTAAPWIGAVAMIPIVS